MNTAILAKIRIIVCPGHYAVIIIRRSHIPTSVGGICRTSAKVRESVEVEQQNGERGREST